jgi:hypothetical protein
MGEKMRELKAFLKDTAKDIRGKKIDIKEKQRNNIYAGGQQWELLKLKSIYRHHHIAYSELRGRCREEIESPRAENLPDNEWIQELKERYLDVEPQTLYTSA